MIEYILFDLGFVLVELNGMPWFRENEPELSDTEIHRKWLSHKSVTDYESGLCGSNAFFEQVVTDLEIETHPTEFRRIYEEWVVGEYKGASQLVKKLKKNYRVGCLSNTNPVHIRRLENMGNLLEHFDDTFYSYEIGVMKPLKPAYKHVLNIANMEAEQVLFIDDSEDNILAARELGLRAEQAKGFEEVKQALKRHKVS